METTDQAVVEAHAAVGAGQAAFFDDDFPAARAHFERAFKAFRDGGDVQSAARIAADVAEIHGDVLGNKAAARGWIARGMRLIEPLGPCVARGHLELALIACEATAVVSQV